MRLSFRNYASSAYLPGNVGFINIPNTAALTPGTSSFGVSFWLRTAQVPTNAGTNVVVQMNSANYALGWLINDNSNDLSIYVASGGPSFTIPKFFTTAGQGINNSWMHLAMTANTSDSKIRIYANGALIGTSSAITAWNITATGATRIGVSADLGASDTSKYADIIFYKGTIPSDSDIAALYYRNVLPPGATNRYLLSDGSGTNAIDSIGGNTGTLGGGAVYVTDSPMKSRVAAAHRTTAGHRNTATTRAKS